MRYLWRPNAGFSGERVPVAIGRYARGMGIIPMNVPTYILRDLNPMENGLLSCLGRSRISRDLLWLRHVIDNDYIENRTVQPVHFWEFIISPRTEVLRLYPC